MAKQRTEKSCYQSRFGSGWITPAQWLAENMCSRKARSEGNDLPSKFWNGSDYWKGQLKLQLKHANDLLKEYDVSLIVEVLNKPEVKKVYSLGLKSVLIPLLKERQKQLKFQQESLHLSRPDPIIPIDTTQTPRKPFGIKRSGLQGIRDLENG